MKLIWIFVTLIVIVVLCVSLLADLIAYDFNFILSHIKGQKVEVSRGKCILTAFIFGWNAGLLVGAIIWLASPHWPAPTNEAPIAEPVSMLPEVLSMV